MVASCAYYSPCTPPNWYEQLHGIQPLQLPLANPKHLISQTWLHYPPWPTYNSLNRSGLSNKNHKNATSTGHTADDCITHHPYSFSQSSTQETIDEYSPMKLSDSLAPQKMILATQLQPLLCISKDDINSYFPSFHFIFNWRKYLKKSSFTHLFTCSGGRV